MHHRVVRKIKKSLLLISLYMIFRNGVKLKDFARLISSSKAVSSVCPFQTVNKLNKAHMYFFSSKCVEKLFKGHFAHL